ncbi:MAG: polyphosphate kinase 1 [Treponema sp.]|nr:polyphosphate kinase 1 [Treponema sp.]
MAENKEKGRYFNRELSWLEFNARVLSEALRKDNPLLERLNFLGIVSSNFGEFFQVRVASLKREASVNPRQKDSSGLTAKECLEKISKRSHELVEKQYKCLMGDILPALAKEGLVYVRPKDFSTAQKNYAEGFFHHDLFPLLTPLRTDLEEFPHIGSMRLHVAFLLDKMPGVHRKETGLLPKSDSDLIALVPIPSSLPRVLYLPSEDGTKRFSLVDDIVTLFGRELFPGYNVKESMVFELARDADFAVDEEAGDQFIQAMKEVLVKRQSSFPVCLWADSGSKKLLSAIKEKLALEDKDIYRVDGIIEPGSLMEISEGDEAARLSYPNWPHFYPAELPEDGSYWNTLRQKDVLLNVPYESYDPVVKLIQDASVDSEVLAIKMTLYRTGSNSPIVQALKRASVNGKSVTVFVELKARFDEQRNISWAQELEDAGATVIYGMVNLKVHAKICLIIRKESDGIRRYVHLSTGNYNPKTARLYQDFSIFTSNPDIALDATLFFNVVSGYSIVQSMHSLYMAPVSIKSRLIEMIEREISWSSPDNPGLIMAKMNSLCHDEIIEELYKASRAGVRVMLNIRGICTLIPGVKGMSENIEVSSVVGRYLEHSRVFYFKNGGSEELYLSSADWMVRNLDKRIELMFPVLDKEAFKTVKEELELYFRDNTHRHCLCKDGGWKEVKTPQGETPVSVQEEMQRKYERLDEARKSQPKLEFVVRRKN